MKTNPRTLYRVSIGLLTAALAVVGFQYRLSHENNILLTEMLRRQEAATKHLQKRNEALADENLKAEAQILVLEMRTDSQRQTIAHLRMRMAIAAGESRAGR